MNKSTKPDNVRTAIAIMERAARTQHLFDMASHQERGDNSGGIVTTEEEMHRCGNTACFAGWVAVSPEWAAMGGTIADGVPQLLVNGLLLDDEAAIAEWLGIHEEHANAFIYGNALSDSEDQGFYPVRFRDARPEHVIDKLKELL